jgi:hypothetical protein
MKDTIDKFYSRHYDHLLKVATDLCVYYRKNYDPETLVHNAYLYLVNKKDKVQAQEQVEIWSLQFIKMQVQWWNSETNRMERLITGSEEMNINELEFMGKVDVKRIDDINHKRKVIEIYKNNVATKVQERILEAYLDKGIKTVRALAEHFEIPNSSAHVRLKKIKAQIATINKKSLNQKDES